MAATPEADFGQYLVVARRYRPQSFTDLVGQGQVSQALANAITTHRVGHAYLFTGARGVGKTSTARIFAKCLNCETGPTPAPCNQCDLCQAVSVGEDVDVLEIDGASNRGIDEIRQLRSNVNIRPSRARYKIYIIDEVHMLTNQAFNALLKTLEEPPEHVKFIFCTTDPEKIPITVLSRCQRFDFPPVETRSIAGRLRQIVDTEGVPADEDALQLLARRAAGSMRDSQSLLEQLLSFCSGKITVDEVHRMLGTVRGGRLAALAGRLIERDPAGAFRELDQAIAEGVDVGQVAEQLLGYFRDMLTATLGCSSDLLLTTAPDDHAALAAAGKRFGMETMLAAIQVLDQAIMRMRQSPHVRTLVEIALVRVCKLEDLDELATLVTRLQSTTPPSVPGPGTRPAPTAAPVPPPVPSAPPPLASSDSAEKKTTVSDPAPPPAPIQAAPVAPPPVSAVELHSGNVAEIWQQAIATLEDMTADSARKARHIAIAGPNRLAVAFAKTYAFQKESCERPDRKEKLEQALARLTGRTIRIDFSVVDEPAARTEAEARTKVVPNRRQQLREIEKHPIVKQAVELFQAEVTRYDEPPQ